MMIEENDAGGLTVFLFAGDDLDEVPESHRDLVTPSIAKVFDGPRPYFLDLAGKCKIPHMAAWIRALLDGGAWALKLHRSLRQEWSAANFCWWSDTVTSAEIALPAGLATGGLPEPLVEYYRLVDGVSWMPFGCAGGLYGQVGHAPLASFSELYHGSEAGVDPEKSFVFGLGQGGDMLIYTQDGRAGWTCVENGKIHLLGTIEATIDWVYGELLANRPPDFDYSWLLAGS